MNASIVGHYGESFSASIESTISVAMVDEFAHLTGDHSSLHTDEEFAMTTLYGRRVVHGMLPVSLLRACPDLVAPGSKARVGDISAHFSGPVHIGDTVRVSVRLTGIDDEGPSFEFDVANLTSGTVVTNGKFGLRYMYAGALLAHAVADHESSGDPASAESLADAALVSLKENVLDISDIRKGQTESFEFSLSVAAVERFEQLIGAGTPRPPLVEAGAPGRLSTVEFLGLGLLSAFVGMRIPGRAATFVEFAVEFSRPLDIGRHYCFAGKVKHVSRGTRMLKMESSISEMDDDCLARGTIVALVNEPVPVRRPTLSEMRERFWDPGLRDRVAIVTGASGAIGESVVKLLAVAGCRVVVNYRSNGSSAERIVQEVTADGGDAVAIAADVADAASVRAMVEQAVARFGRVDILVNNAARNFDAIAYEDLEWEDIRLDLEVALHGAFNCCKAVTPTMLAAGRGKIINISSVYAANPPRDQLKYVVSKAALEGLTRALAAEFADRNIQVNTVVPGFVDTEKASRMHMGIRRREARRSAAGRNARPEEVAQAVLFLASSYSSYTTGQRLLVTGGGPPYL